MVSDFRKDELNGLTANYIFKKDKQLMEDFCNGLNSEELKYVKSYISEFISFIDKNIKVKE